MTLSHLDTPRARGRSTSLVIGLMGAFLATMLVAAQAHAVSVLVPLTGGQEEPEPVFTGAFGTALLDYNESTNEISVEVQVFGLSIDDLLDIPDAGPFHLHVETDDEPTDQVGPIAVTFGTSANWVEHINGITLSAVGTDVGAFSLVDLQTALKGGKTYLNLHTQQYRGGELRGDVPGLPITVIPEPGTALLMSLGLIGLASIRREPNRAG